MADVIQKLIDADDTRGPRSVVKGQGRSTFYKIGDATAHQPDIAATEAKYTDKYDSDEIEYYN